MRVVVVGAGLSGLTAAYRLAHPRNATRKPVDLIVLESRERVGGAIWTDQRDGFTLEGGADSFITNKRWGVDLCAELGLSDQILNTDSRNRRSFVVRNGRLLPVPDGLILLTPGRLGPMLTTPILSFRGKLRMLLDLVLPKRTDDTDESLASFVKRRFGREMLDRLVQPLVGGIYTADPNELSLKATLPHFLEMEQMHGGLIRGGLRQARERGGTDREASGARYGLFVTLRDGMQSLPNAIAATLPPGALRTNTTVRRVSRVEPAGPWRLELLNGTPIDADILLFSTAAHATARLVDGFDPDLAMQLRSIPYASSAIVQLAFRRDQVAHPLDGFGAVVPRIEGLPILAISFTSVKFPCRAPAGTVLLRVFVGGATQPELFELEDEDLLALVRGELARLLGVSGEPILAEIARHPRAMPQYTLGHIERVQAIRDRAALYPGLLLAGNAFDGVGIPDCIRSGEAAANAAVNLIANAAAPAAA